MSISFECPSCGNRMTAPKSAAGRTGKCNKCHQSITAPTTSSTAPTPKSKPVVPLENPAAQLDLYNGQIWLVILAAVVAAIVILLAFDMSLQNRAALALVVAWGIVVASWPFFEKRLSDLNRRLTGNELSKDKTSDVREAIDVQALQDAVDAIEAVIHSTVKRPSKSSTAENREAMTTWLYSRQREIGKAIEVAGTASGNQSTQEQILEGLRRLRLDSIVPQFLERLEFVSGAKCRRQFETAMDLIQNPICKQYFERQATVSEELHLRCMAPRSAVLVMAPIVVPLAIYLSTIAELEVRNRISLFFAYGLMIVCYPMLFVLQRRRAKQVKGRPPMPKLSRSHLDSPVK